MRNNTEARPEKVVFGGFSFSRGGISLDNTARALVREAAEQDAVQEFRTICEIFLDRTYPAPNA